MPVSAQHGRQNTLYTRFCNQTQRQQNKHQNRRDVKSLRRVARNSTNELTGTKVGAALLFSAILTGAAVSAVAKTVKEKQPEVKGKITATSEALVKPQDDYQSSYFQEEETYFDNHLIKQYDPKGEEFVKYLLEKNIIDAEGNNGYQRALIRNIGVINPPSREVPVHRDINGRTANVMHAVMKPNDKLDFQWTECRESDIQKVPALAYMAMTNSDNFKDVIKRCGKKQLVKFKKKYFTYKKMIPDIIKSLMYTDRACNSNNHYLFDHVKGRRAHFPVKDKLTQYLLRTGIKMMPTRGGLATNFVKVNGYYQFDDRYIKKDWLSIVDTRENARKVKKMCSTRPDMAKKLAIPDNLDLIKALADLAIRDLSEEDKQTCIYRNVEENYKILCEYIEKQQNESLRHRDEL